MSGSPHLAQVAFSVVDLRVTDRWFRDGLGLRAAGGTRWRTRGPLASAIQGLPRVASTCAWLVAGNEFFQLELFEFERPLATLMPHDARASDIGYRRIGVWVADFDGTLARLADLGSSPLHAPVGPTGDRRACVRNPDGVYVEILERDPLSGAGFEPSRSTSPVAVRSVTLSVEDLAQAEAFFRGLGLKDAGTPPRPPEHESLWGLAGARTRATALAAGGVLVELVEYFDPGGRGRPADHRICDQGILNIALGVRRKRDHVALYQRALAAGAQPNFRPVALPGAGVVYVNDPQQFSVELLRLAPWWDRHWGFVAHSASRRSDPATHVVERTVRIAAPVTTTWAVITDHAAMGEWLPLVSTRRVRDGAPDPDGRGSERRLTLGVTGITEQVVVHEPPTSYSYRVTRGSPFRCHHGEIRLRPNGDHTELTWRIRFRPKLPGTGCPLAMVLSSLLGRALRSGLKPHTERLARMPARPLHLQPEKGHS